MAMQRNERSFQVHGNAHKNLPSKAEAAFARVISGELEPITDHGFASQSSLKAFDTRTGEQVIADILSMPPLPPRRSRPLPQNNTGLPNEQTENSPTEQTLQAGEVNIGTATKAEMEQMLRAQDKRRQQRLDHLAQTKIRENTRLHEWNPSKFPDPRG